MGDETEKIRARTILPGRIETLPRDVPHAPAHPLPQNAFRKGDLVETEPLFE